MNAKHLSVSSTVSSLDKKQEEDPDLLQSFVFENSVVKPQTPHFLPEDAEPQELPEYYSTETLRLSRTQMEYVANGILKNCSLKYLYLEGNQISTLPQSMFISLPGLLWLDLRNNQITSLPAEIGLHRSLTTILLEGNPISELPPELGNVITLKGLNLRNCPITFPPRDIVNQGLQSILQYLRSTMAKRAVSMRKSSPELPVMEKLQLTDLMEEQDELVDEAELQRFRELQHKMNLLDKAELGSVAQGDRNPKSRFPSIIKRKKATTKASIIPELPLFNTQQWKRPGERTAAVRELKDKQSDLEQRQKSADALRKWQTQARITQERKIPEQKKHAQKQEEAASSGTRLSQTYQETRSPRVLEQKIRVHFEKMQERLKNPVGTASEEMAAAKQDMEQMTKLQAHLLERKRNFGNCFTLFNGDTWPRYTDK